MEEEVRSALSLVEKLKKRLSEVTAEGSAGNEEAISKVLKKLSVLPMSLEILQVTQIGRQVNSLRKWKGSKVSARAKALVKQWKQLLPEASEVSSSVAPGDDVAGLPLPYGVLRPEGPGGGADHLHTGSGHYSHSQSEVLYDHYQPEPRTVGMSVPVISVESEESAMELCPSPSPRHSASHTYSNSHGNSNSHRHLHSANHGQSASPGDSYADHEHSDTLEYSSAGHGHSSNDTYKSEKKQKEKHKHLHKEKGRKKDHKEWKTKGDYSEERGHSRDHIDHSERGDHSKDHHEHSTDHSERDFSERGDLREREDHRRDHSERKRDLGKRGDFREREDHSEHSRDHSDFREREDHSERGDLREKDDHSERKREHKDREKKKKKKKKDKRTGQERESSSRTFEMSLNPNSGGGTNITHRTPDRRSRSPAVIPVGGTRGRSPVGVVTGGVSGRSPGVSSAGSGAVGGSPASVTVPRDKNTTIGVKRKEPEPQVAIAQSKRSRTQVYSGKKSQTGPQVVVSLFDMCMKILIDNIDVIEEVGPGVPYHVLEPLLQRCSAAQLKKLEEFNPHLVEDTEELWRKHVLKDFKVVKLPSTYTWRDLYREKEEEREEKLRSLTARIKANKHAREEPVRKVKLAVAAVKPGRRSGVRRGGFSRPMEKPQTGTELMKRTMKMAKERNHMVAFKRGKR